MSSSNYEQILASYIGPFSTWEDFSTKSQVIRLEDGTEYRIDHVHFMEKTAEQLLLYIVGLVTGESRKFVLQAYNSTSAKRIREINEELDIMRGIVPTPKGYTVDLGRAKILMKELRELMK